MSKTDDGGPAFPRPHSEDKFNDEIMHSQRGMSLRDWFAGQALAGMNAAAVHKSAYLDERSSKFVAISAYVQADAMLKARIQ